MTVEVTNEVLKLETETAGLVIVKTGTGDQ